VGNEQFGPAYADDIGDIIQKYSQYNAEKKTELLSGRNLQLNNYHESKL
jgi:hypothetical protein